MMFPESVACCSDNVGHLEGGPVHCFFLSLERFIWLGLETSIASSGLGTACRWRRDKWRYPTSVVKTESIEDWQKIVNQLIVRQDFHDTGPFYRVVQVSEIKTGRLLSMVNNQFELEPAKEYEMIIDHFLPNESPLEYQLGRVHTN